MINIEKQMANAVLFSINSKNKEKIKDSYFKYLDYVEALGKEKNVDLLIQVNNRYVEYQVEEVKREMLNVR